jgi:hypothetical protein
MGCQVLGDDGVRQPDDVAQEIRAVTRRDAKALQEP